MGKISKSKRRLLDRRDLEIYAMYHDKENPKNANEILQELSKRPGDIYRMTRQNVYAILNRVEQQQKNEILTNE